MYLGIGQMSHSFIVIPDSPYPLLGRDLLPKIGAHIYFTPNGAHMTDQEGHPIQILTLQLEDEFRLHQRPPPDPGEEISAWLQEFPTAWPKTRGIGLAAHRSPIWIELKPGVSSTRVKQYPMSQEAEDYPSYQMPKRTGHLSALLVSLEYSLLVGQKTKFK